jgi:hypothetical protein
MMKTFRGERVVMLILRPPSMETAGRGPSYYYTLAFTVQLRKIMENSVRLAVKK